VIIETTRRYYENGMELHDTGLMLLLAKEVALRAGAWIETPVQPSTMTVDGAVALRAGAWIETASSCDRRVSRSVALRAGAWIETTSPSSWSVATVASPSVRGRGLKQRAQRADVQGKPRRPPCGGVD